MITSIRTTVNICFFLGWAPFVIVWWIYNTVFTMWMLQTYFLTFNVFINYLRWGHRKNLRTAWFWKAMASTAFVLHPLILVSMWFADVASKTKWHAAATMLFLMSTALVLEFTALDKTMGYLRPNPEASDAQGTDMANS